MGVIMQLISAAKKANLFNHVAEGQLAEHPVELAPVGPRAGHLLAIDVLAAASGLAKLVKLAVQGLPVGADAGIARQPFFGVKFLPYLTAN
jgi:hypothetical protein